eukprot:m.76079 g.76079  ORF g.76079 m.76079 type:complete len:201 (-) comp8103_c1_seq1:259-861(-)
MLRVLAVVALLVAVAHAEGPTVLTESTFDAEVFGSGKNSIIKFYAPWCGHCKAMKPAWDDLGAEFASSSSVLIGDVDCTVERSVCEKFGVSGYPTIKYFTAETGEEGAKYEGRRDLDSLREFVDSKLKVACDPVTHEGCDDREKSFIEKVKEKGQDFMQAQLERLEGMKASKMTSDLKKWLHQRLNILKSLVSKDSKDEL